MTLDSKRRSKFEIKEDPIFLSMADYWNNYFTSDNTNNIIHFYNTFENRDQLIQWMRGRPKGAANIYEIDGDKDIVIVIPTADFNGKYAKECRENIFKGFQIIFVESAEFPDPYFNYAHNCNLGIKKAMEYNSKWIIVSNDDMYKIDGAETLKKELMKVDSTDFDLLFAKEEPYVTQTSQVARRRPILKFFLSLLNGGAEWNKIENKMRVDFKGAPTRGISSILYKEGRKFTNFISFAVFSFNFCKLLQGNLFDEIYLNAAEDTDLSIRAFTEYKWNIINFKIGALRGKTFTLSKIRRFREIPSNAYLNYKIESGKLKVNQLSGDWRKK